MATRFEQHNSDFSDRAHVAAQRLIYPHVFDKALDRMRFHTTNVRDGGHNAVLDGEMGIDRIVRVAVPRLRRALSFTVQERFRRLEFARWKDITVTEWNHPTNLPSELYKIQAHYFVYGYFDEARDRFADAIVINVPDLLTTICAGTMDFDKRRNPKGQDFLGFRFQDLYRAGVVRYWQNEK